MCVSNLKTLNWIVLSQRQGQMNTCGPLLTVCAYCCVRQSDRTAWRDARLQAARSSGVSGWMRPSFPLDFCSHSHLNLWCYASWLINQNIRLDFSLHKRCCCLFTKILFNWYSLLANHIRRMEFEEVDDWMTAFLDVHEWFCQECARFLELILMLSDCFVPAFMPALVRYHSKKHIVVKYHIMSSHESAAWVLWLFQASLCQMPMWR